MTRVKMSSKNQMVVPREAREALGVTAGDEIIVVPRGSTVILMRKPPNVLKALRGSAKGLYGDVEAYLKKERASWEKSRRS
ncbi:MAG: AbrB/MazE/SpoVT family DNA-binding domain-containing protein [Planctomycetaceae bacterium]|nr:AbrB/MazE/SpoVT family DNA-binding domain-containing protein [Planctomycetaceae bacterium]